MVKYILFVFMFAFVMPVHAQEATVSPSSVPSRQPLRSIIKTIKPEIKAEVKTEIKADATAKKEGIVQAKADLKDKVATIRQAFKDQLKNIKSTAKRDIAIRIEANIYKLNQDFVARFTAILDTLTSITGRISTQIQIATANGKDVTEVTADVAKANTAIASARTLVQVQATTAYKTTITDSTLRQSFLNVRKTFHADIVKVRDAVITARVAVKVAVTAFIKINGPTASTEARISAPAHQSDEPNVSDDSVGANASASL